MSSPTTEPVVLGADFVRDPHSVYDRLRAEGAVHRAIMPTGLKVWLITSYEEGRALLADPRLSKNMADAGHLFTLHQTDMSRQRDYSHSIQQSMINMDPPDHTRLRGLVGKAFTMRQVNRLRPRIEEIADELLDSLAGRTEFDIVDDYAAPLVSTVISELLGVPEGDRAEFRTTSEILTSDADRDEVNKASNALLTLVSAIVEAKRAEPDDRLLSSLILAADGEDRLTHEEVVSLAVVLFVGGFDTTVNLIGNGTLALLRNPDQLAALRADPSLLPGAVEEFLRFDGSANISHFRRTTAAVPVGDTTIPADEFVFVGLLAANRDAARYPDPDALDVTRSATGHLAFGHGIHHCVGAPLARAESEIAFGRLLNRFPVLNLAIDPEKLTQRPSMLHRGVRSLPVRTDGVEESG
ncbi:cytochrome P450 family protein [Streptomyces geranii]|uniref:cytochrome P450 family protein n=1 Tax=Streptomyces geranii TaxID=2058923 RepID=UPI000D02742D|nr:cytochrome P450 [Streptomyces geranii]